MTRIIKPPPIAVPVPRPLPGWLVDIASRPATSPDRVRAFVRFAIRRGPLLWLTAFVLAVPAFGRTFSLYVHLKSDLEELLPRRAPSVVALNEYRARMTPSRLPRHHGRRRSPRAPRGRGGLSSTRWPNESRFTRPIWSPGWHRMYDERAFLREHAALFIDHQDLVDLRRRIEERRDYRSRGRSTSTSTTNPRPHRSSSRI